MRPYIPTKLPRRLLALAIFGICAAGSANAQTTKTDAELPPPLPIEETGVVLSLPESYPESWIMVDEASFFNHYGGKVIILDALEKTHAKRIKGMVHKSLLGNFAQHKERSEFYVLETFHERGGRGPRTDVLAIYDRSTLKIKKELIWPTERLQALPERYAMAVTGDQQLLVAANLNPATSFTVVDLDSEEIIDTISTPGCVLTFPTGERSVASLCSDGAMMTTVLDESGQLKSQQRMESFFDSDDTAIFEHPAIVDGIAYFPSFRGTMHTINLQGEVAEYVEEWSLVSEEQQQENWRPSGIGLIHSDDQGLVYIIFQADGAEGTQTHGGSQVWVFDVQTKERVKVIELPSHGLSLALTRGDKPTLVVTNGEMNLDVFDATSGEYIQTLSDFGNQTPLLLHESY
ncbi:amine dehydrogenase large subunit [Granulosicoccus antarcticus]|uniref:Aralkylamine dehydrogenase heavy chain n=1 Tax=Granulosicoccus antarcticus IMCC3135 TaxID=1192854 RepID=A0A2Z2NRF1_9GAMM|nr:amine dehydrogenase large subunit [Granulosicoccus antarcticus]ASJ74022.1 Aralkylamine dehydrogenase heavy chain [Granulosicoccus antarcticus IMCC3135]